MNDRRAIYYPRSLYKIIRNHLRSYQIFKRDIVRKEFDKESAGVIIGEMDKVAASTNKPDNYLLPIYLNCICYLLNINKSLRRAEYLKLYTSESNPYKFIVWSLLKSFTFLTDGASIIFKVIYNLIINGIEYNHLKEYIYKYHNISTNKLEDFINESLLLRKKKGIIEWYDPLINTLENKVGSSFFYRQFDLNYNWR